MRGLRHKIRRLFLFCCLTAALLHFTEPRADTDFIFEQFESLDQWSPFTFPNINDHSSYGIVQDGEVSCLEMQATGGASALILDNTFDVYSYPVLKWRWKVDSIYSRGDYREKEGDDYPARLYVMFAYDADTASWARRLQYGTAKMLYGKYPPDSSLNYIWANQLDAPDVIANVYVDRARMIPVERGKKNLGQWRQYHVDIVADYRKAFGTDPPRTASLAVMIDSDNTGERSRSCIDFIRISRPDAPYN